MRTVIYYFAIPRGSKGSKYTKNGQTSFFVFRPGNLHVLAKHILLCTYGGPCMLYLLNTLKIEDFVHKAKELITRMRNQGAEMKRTTRSIRKIILAHPESFSQFGTSTEHLIENVIG